MSEQPLKLLDKKVTVMGLGAHGGALGNIEWLVGQGAKVLATDLKAAAQLRATIDRLQKLNLPVELVLGQHREQDFIETDLVLRNPAVPRTSKFLEIARKHGVPIEMDSSLFFQLAPSRRIVGITGSKGKTTTSHAIAHILRAKYPLLALVGVEDTSPLKALPTIKNTNPVVFELSSWRLEALAEHQLSPAVAVVTSLYRDHLNTYDSFEDYERTKQTIVRYQKANDWCVLNADDPCVRQWPQNINIKSRIFWYSLGKLTDDQEGIFIHDNHVLIRLSDRTNMPDVPVMPVAELPTEAAHIRRNLLPAILLGYLEGLEMNLIKHQLQSWKMPPHRLEFVGEKNGVRYINDSAATIPEATLAALESVRGRGSIVLLFGGGDKRLDFFELAAQVSNYKIRAFVFLPGTATPKIKMALKDILKNDFTSVDSSSMAEAVQKASELAKTGDIVLLSPGATSFDLFQHEFDRGRQFKAEVSKLL